MKVSGSRSLEAPPAAVFEAIRDPGILLAVIPGCQAVALVGQDEYAGLISLRLPGVAGAYRTRVRLVDAVPPERVRLEGSVEGDLGSIVGHADLTLTPQTTGTLLAYQGLATIGGPLARLDSRFTEHLAGSLIAQGLRALDRRLVPEPAAATAAGGRTTSTEVLE